MNQTQIDDAVVVGQAAGNQLFANAQGDLHKISAVAGFFLAALYDLFDAQGQADHFMAHIDEQIAVILNPQG